MVTDYHFPVTVSIRRVLKRRIVPRTVSIPLGFLSPYLVVIYPWTVYLFFTDQFPFTRTGCSPRRKDLSGRSLVPLS